MIDETTTATLTPCPVCGTPAELFPIDENVVYGGCVAGRCSVDGPICKTPDEAAAAWNALALDVQRGKLAAKMRDALDYLKDWLENQHFACSCDGDECGEYCYLATATRAVAEYDALTAPTKEATR